MSPSEGKSSGTGNKPSRNSSDARRPRSIRFADLEWNLIERAAARHGIAAGQLVREGAIALAEDRLGESPPATLSPGHLALIEEMYRYVYVMATLDRERLLESGRGDDISELIDAARKTMSQTMKEGPA